MNNVSVGDVIVTAKADGYFQEERYADANV